jgi:hypothetical protein
MKAAEYISNTSPLQYLHQIGELELLPRLFRHIVVPGAVETELAAGRALGHALPDVGALTWVDVRRDIHAPRTILAHGDLGAGEREVLWLATAIPGSMVFLDDSDARRAALALSIPVSGTLGILLFAKQKGMIGLVRPLLDLLEAARFRMSPRLRGSVLDRAGESA